jgi:glutathione S-transferase
MVTTFTSVPVQPAVRDPLLDHLAAAHAERPLLPGDPRAVAARVEPVLQALGLTAVRIRGTVSWRGVEVDHVWLAVGPDPAWVLDAAFPLHVPAFAHALAGYVAGTVTAADLADLAAAARIEDRVVGTVPDPAVYRGRPYWGRPAAAVGGSSRN